MCVYVCDDGPDATNEGRYVDSDFGKGGIFLCVPLPMWEPIFSYFRLSERERKRNGRRRRHRVAYGKQNDPNGTDAQQITNSQRNKA